MTSPREIPRRARITVHTGSCPYPDCRWSITSQLGYRVEVLREQHMVECEHRPALPPTVAR